MRAVTIKDVARRLGISHSTVSRVINDDPRISGTTRAAVLKALRSMNYIPNLAARGLAGGRSNTVAVVTFSYFTDFAAELMRGIEQEALKTKYSLDYYTTSRYTYIGTTGKDAYTYEKILNEKRADALIVFSGILYGKKGITERYRKAGINLVFVEGRDTWGSRVHYDNEAAAALAVRHFVSGGRRRFGMLTGSTRDVQSFNERHRSFLRTARSLGQKGPQANVFEYVEDTPELARNAMEFFIKRGVDAVYAASGDRHAFRLLQEAKKLGIDVPGKLAIIGQDDTLMAAAAGLTTIRQPIMEMGRRAMQIAAESIENRSMVPADDVFQPSLVVRKTA